MTKGYASTASAAFRSRPSSWQAPGIHAGGRQDSPAQSRSRATARSAHPGRSDREPGNWRRRNPAKRITGRFGGTGLSARPAQSGDTPRTLAARRHRIGHPDPRERAGGTRTRAGHCGHVPGGAVRHMRRSSARWRTNGPIRNGYQASTAVLTRPVAMVYIWPETLTFIVLVKQCTSRLRGNAGSQGVLLTGHGVTAAAGTQPTTDRKS